MLKPNAALGDTIKVTLGTGAPNVAEVENRLGTDPLPSPSVSASEMPSASASPSASSSGGWGDITTRTADESICE